MATDLVNPISGITRGTSVATTSGSAIDYTSIPSTVTLIIIALNGVSTTGTTGFSLQIGSGSIDTSGYANATSNSAQSTTEFPLTGGSSAAAGLYSGTIMLTLNSSNTWAMSASVGRTDTAAQFSAGGTKTLAGTLDRLRLKTGNGTDTFDAGFVNITYL